MSEYRWRLGDPDYPIRDAEFLDKMPPVLFAKGDRPDAFDAPRVAIVGTRSASPLGLADASEIGAFLARAGVAVISGLALGIDGAAHEGALEGGGLTVGVVASGLDVVYPRRHARLYERVQRQGLIVGEHPPGTEPLPWRFPIRNRIIAALADVVLVVEAKATGGSHSTADYAKAYNRTLFALPGSRRNPAAAGCNALIRDNATPLLDPSDLLLALGHGDPEQLAWGPPARPTTPDERAVLQALAGEPAAIDELQQRAGLTVERLGAALRALEQAGGIRRHRGLWWPR